MNSNNQAFKMDLIRNEVSLVNSLLSTLHEEFTVLKNLAPPEEIINLATQKEALLSAIDETSAHRIAVLPDTAPELLTEPLNSLWKNLLEIATACQKQNQINGIIINANQRHIEQATIILSGIQPEMELRYDSLGETTSERLPRSIAKA